MTSSTGGVNTVYGYTEYGVPSTLSGALSRRFRYTGQTWLSEVGLYYYKARMYAPSLGRFMQADPIGYGDGMNMYAYVHNDPINGTDPSGLAEGFSNITCTQSHWVGRITSSSDPSRVGKIAWDDGLMTSCTSSGASGALGMWDGFQNRDGRENTTVIVRGKKPPPAKVFGGRLKPADYQLLKVYLQSPPSIAPVDNCAFRNSSGTCVYVRDKKGGLQFTPEYQKQACQNYHAMKKSQDQVSKFTGAPGAILGTAGGLGFKNGLGIFGAALSFENWGMKFATPPPGCEA